MIDPAAHARLESWKQLLLDLSPANRLLDAIPDATCIALPDPDPMRLAAALAGGGAIALEGDALAEQATVLRRALRSQADRGHALWLALGVLVWTDAEHRAHRAPIALYPVVLEAGAPRLIAADGLRPRGNPVLAEKLERDFGLLLARPAETFDLETLFAEAESIALTRPGWRIESDTRLGIFTEVELASADALDDTALAHPLLRQLATGTTSFQQPSAAAAEAIARPGAPPDLLAPLDADGSQLAAVAAAGAGASFVLQGAPGSGKSQTIANLVVHCMGLGKSVLFVSPKIAALEVVQQRLAAIGLGDLCLELFGAKASAVPVLAQLGRVLERAFRPGSKTNVSLGDDRLAELRDALDGHVAALHRVGPFGRSLHDVLGRLVELRSSARAALAESDATGLDGVTFERRCAAIAALAAAAVPVEPVAAHPWRASSLESFTGIEAPLAAIDEAAGAGAALAAAVREVAGLVPGLVARTRDQLQALGALAALAAASPRPGAELLTHLRGSRGDEIGEQIALLRARGTGSVDPPRDPLSFLLLAKRHRALVTEVRERFTEDVEDLDASAAWQQLRKWTTRPLRFVALRTVRADVRRVAVPMELTSDEAMVIALEAVIAERACRAALASAAEPARRWFGELAGDPQALALDRLDAAVGWAADLRKAFDAIDLIGGEAGRATAWRALVAQVAASPNEAPNGDAAAAFGRLAESVARWIPALARLSDATGIDRATLAAGDDHLAALRERLETLRHRIDSLGAWVAFHAARRNALAAGAGPSVAALERGDLGAAELALAWERATLLAWAEAELGDSALGQFHGAAHHAHVAAFADLDRASLALVRSRALVQFAERVPAANIRAPRDTGRNAAADPEIDLLRATLKAQGPAVPIRSLFAALPTLLPKLAPCLVATPEAVAEHLAPTMRFDLVVFDEASQLGIAHALGALARADAAVIVGDSQQLPPRESMPSVLEVAIAAKLPQLRLTSHYRSRHEDLFAFANERFYGNRINVFVAAHGGSDLGISLRHVEANLAEAVVAEVIARTIDPAQRPRSIAVVTASRAMQDDIDDLLDHARALDPTLARADASTVPPLVREVDAMQGEERDVVLLVLDPTTPLDDRRLVVATTRAREQLIVFSSQPADAATGHLGELLAFAQAGGGAARASESAPASPIIDALSRALVERGWTVRHGVGCGPYKLDLAIVDPNDPDRYVMAIEHDGRAYAGALSARDRDRLRPQLLQHLGWRLHRLWALDWWTDPEREIQRAHAAIVTALAASRQRRVSVPPRSDVRVEATAAPTRSRRTTPANSVLQIPPKPTPGEGVPVSSTAAVSSPVSSAATLPTLAAGSAPTRIARNTIPIGPYMAAAIPNGRRTPDDLFATRHLAELGKVIEQVLAAEAPMHVDLLARRVGGYFGVGRVTQRVKEQIVVALAGRGRFGDEQDVVWRLDQDPTAVPAVRVSGSGPTARREVIEIPLSELASAARIVVERASGIAAPDLIRDAARLLGFARITEDVTSRVELGVRLAEVRELIRIDNGKASVPLD